MKTRPALDPVALGSGAPLSTCQATGGGNSTRAPGGPEAGERVTQTRGTAHGTRGFYAVALMSLSVSVNTSWRFFAQDLGVTNTWERTAMFAVLEAAQVACGTGMALNVRETGQPGRPRLVAWLLCAVSGYMAWNLSGPATGLARVVLGPLLGLVMLHLALGIEVRQARNARTGTWTLVRDQVRERLLSALGLTVLGQDAGELRRARATSRAARLAKARFAFARVTRVRRALRLADLNGDPVALRKLLDQVAVAHHAVTLREVDPGSPWDGFTARDPDPDPEATAETRDVVTREVTVPVTLDPGSRDPDPPADPGDPGATIEGQVQEVVNLILALGHDQVTLPVVTARLGLSDSTAKRRLRAARASLARAS